MLRLFLCLRYLRKKKIVFLSIAAVALSVSLLIVVASLFTGFIKAVQQAADGALGDVVLSPPVEKVIEKYPLLIERLEETLMPREHVVGDMRGENAVAMEVAEDPALQHLRRGLYLFRG